MALISREEATPIIQPDIIQNNATEDILQGPSPPPIITTHDTFCCSTWTTKRQFVSKKYEDEFYFTPVSNSRNLLSQQEQLVNASQLILCPTTGYLDTTEC